MDPLPAHLCKGSESGPSARNLKENFLEGQYNGLPEWKKLTPLKS